ncbi:MAG TPA: hypothetical protein VG370_16905 [Chloroflexota bacterium]|nr:hypothetical protein [Chloroflexota bacterium]
MSQRRRTGRGRQRRGVDVQPSDGTLVDSAEYHRPTWREALAAEGFALTRERFEAAFGRTNEAVLGEMSARHWRARR